MTSKLTQTVRKAGGILEGLAASPRRPRSHAAGRDRFNGAVATGFIGIYSSSSAFPRAIP